MNFKENKMTFDERVFKAAQKIVNSSWFLGCFMGATFAYLIYRGIA